VFKRGASPSSKIIFPLSKNGEGDKGGKVDINLIYTTVCIGGISKL
jgi:hypothetical protein